jgi:hypothetical protein
MLTFNGHTFRFPATALLWTASDCAVSFESLPNVRRANCSLATNSDTERVYSVKLMEFPITPHENNLFHHDGQFTETSVAQLFHCDTSLVSGTTRSLGCSIELVSSNATYPGQCVSTRLLLFLCCNV